MANTKQQLSVQQRIIQVGLNQVLGQNLKFNVNGIILKNAIIMHKI